MVNHTGGGVWENFDSWHDELGFNTKAMNSQCHPDHATILPWIIHRLAGIRPGHGLKAGGFKHFEICPQMVDSLNAVSCRFHSARGPIAVRYEKNAGAFDLEIAVPPNTSATVTLPTDSLDGVTESGGLLTRAEGVSVVAAGTVLLHSGRYRFAIPGRSKP
jgi:alpha-L-rhamnosidase